MLLAFVNFILLLAEEAGGAPWYNKPYLPAWRWFNLFLFLGVMFFLLRRPIQNFFRTRREEIRRDLMRAQEERDAALAKLEEVEARLVNLNSEVEAIRERARREAEEERERIARSTEDEIRKLGDQARRDIEGASKAARQDLRRYAAEQSVRLAEEMIRARLRPEDDARLMNEYVEKLGGVRS
jgi:F-type H+-transporting ATPase subunit b